MIGKRDGKEEKKKEGNLPEQLQLTQYNPEQPWGKGKGESKKKKKRILG